MSLVYDTITIKTLNYNGTVIDSLYFNDTLVYKRAASIKVVYGTDVTSVKVDGVTIANGGSFEYAPGDSKSIVITYSGYVTGDGYVHSVNNNTTLNSTRWKYNTSYTMAGGLSKTVSISSNLVAVSNTITFSLTDAEFNSLSSPTITFNAAKAGTQTYKSKVVSVPYTAYAYETSVTFMGTLIGDKGGTQNFHNSVNAGGNVKTIRVDGNNKLYLAYANNIYEAHYSGSGGGYVRSLNITGASGKVYVNNYTGTATKSGTAQYSYTAYRNETQYYWE